MPTMTLQSNQNENIRYIRYNKYIYLSNLINLLNFIYSLLQNEANFAHISSSPPFLDSKELKMDQRIRPTAVNADSEATIDIGNVFDNIKQDFILPTI